MAWAKSTTTRHTCNDGAGPAFGRKTRGCPRCDELLGGAEPVRWAGVSKREQERRQLAEIEAHFGSVKHRSGGCGPVCTFGDW
jgi:hypothetical protein